tara:strand:+ start:503 stop:718 length:216 start_codon:yes stop_codon:yes gene_type:complete
MRTAKEKEQIISSRGEGAAMNESPTSWRVHNKSKSFTMIASSGKNMYQLIDMLASRFGDDFLELEPVYARR